MEAIRDNLLALSHRLGAEAHGLAMLGEGNTSALLAPGRLLVKASGSCLRTLTDADLVECDLAKILALFEGGPCSDAEIAAALLAARVNEAQKKPSVEALFHGY